MKKSSVSELRTIPGIGPSMERDLIDLGINRIADLRGKNPEIMYDALCTIRNTRIDRCVLYVFRCAVYFAEHEKHNPELLKWWNWKDR
ncbi:MAG TPA: helix-hairpin-helix domain-containing protein [Spirochaetota bacterium]|nr:helix-hairpin-helix domain-containing protein [Spirochaetota bacterium]